MWVNRFKNRSSRLCVPTVNLRGYADAVLSRKEKRRLEAQQFERSHASYIQGNKAVWEVRVGLEVHVQLLTSTKLFSSAPATFDKLPNTMVSIVDAALPGTLPSLNRMCVQQALRAGLALHGDPQITSRFDRKHYFYHDLPMGYQITQQDHPIIRGGYMILHLSNGLKRIRIDRIQLETDSGKSIHDASPFDTLVDLNRAGMPLIEVVTKPDLIGSIESSLFFRKLAYLLTEIGVTKGTMEEGSLRCDANVSVHPIGDWDGPNCERSEIKNLNSVKALVNAIDYEAKRQIELLESGCTVEMETRWFDPIKKITLAGRKKEDKLDYRFFPEPDLPPLRLTQNMITDAGASLPELPDTTLERLQRDFSLPFENAQLICLEPGAVRYFEATISDFPDFTIAASWMINELFGLIHDFKIDLANWNLTPRKFASILGLVVSNKINGTALPKVIGLIHSGDTRSVSDIVESNGWYILELTNEELETICRKVLADSPEEVARYRAGRDRTIKYFVGKVMQDTKGRANPQTVTNKFLELLKL